MIQSDEKSKQQIQKVLGSAILIDGTHVHIQDQWILCNERTHTLTKRQFTFNTEIITDTKGIIIYKTKRYLGSNHDFGIFKKEALAISNIIKSLTGSSNYITIL